MEFLRLRNVVLKPSFFDRQKNILLKKLVKRYEGRGEGNLTKIGYNLRAKP